MFKKNKIHITQQTFQMDAFITVRLIELITGYPSSLTASKQKDGDSVPPITETIPAGKYLTVQNAGPDVVYESFGMILVKCGDKDYIRNTPGDLEIWLTAGAIRQVRSLGELITELEKVNSTHQSRNK